MKMLVRSASSGADRQGTTNPTSVPNLEDIVAEYIEHVWAEGDP